MFWRRPWEAADAMTGSEPDAGAGVGPGTADKSQSRINHDLAPGWGWAGDIIWPGLGIRSMVYIN